jgi:hypothetical protein
MHLGSGDARCGHASGEPQDSVGEGPLAREAAVIT